MSDHRRSHSGTSASSTAPSRSHPSSPHSPRSTQRAPPSAQTVAQNPPAPAETEKPSREELLKRIVSPGSELFKYQPRTSRPQSLQWPPVKNSWADMDSRRHPSSFQQLEKVHDSLCDSFRNKFTADTSHSWEKGPMPPYATPN